MKKLYYVICGKNRKFKKPKMSSVFENTLFFSIIYSKCKMKMKKYSKKKNQLRFKNSWFI